VTPLVPDATTLSPGLVCRRHHLVLLPRSELLAVNDKHIALLVLCVDDLGVPVLLSRELVHLAYVNLA
jgi:hypothetical protein